MEVEGGVAASAGGYSCYLCGPCRCRLIHFFIQDFTCYKGPIAYLDRTCIHLS